MNDVNYICNYVTFICLNAPNFRKILIHKNMPNTIKKELIENWDEDMDRAIREQDVLEHRNQLDIVHNSLNEAIQNSKRVHRYRKAI